MDNLQLTNATLNSNNVTTATLSNPSFGVIWAEQAQTWGNTLSTWGSITDVIALNNL